MIALKKIAFSQVKLKKPFIKNELIIIIAACWSTYDGLIIGLH